MGNRPLRNIIRSQFLCIKPLSGLIKAQRQYFTRLVAKMTAFCRHRAALGDRSRLRYNPRFDFSLRKEENMEAERINSLSALLADLTAREAELRRYL